MKNVSLGLTAQCGAPAMTLKLMEVVWAKWLPLLTALPATMIYILNFVFEKFQIHRKVRA